MQHTLSHHTRAMHPTFLLSHALVPVLPAGPEEVQKQTPRGEIVMTDCVVEDLDERGFPRAMTARSAAELERAERGSLMFRIRHRDPRRSCYKVRAGQPPAVLLLRSVLLWIRIGAEQLPAHCASCGPVNRSCGHGDGRAFHLHFLTMFLCRCCAAGPQQRGPARRGRVAEVRVADAAGGRAAGGRAGQQARNCS